MKLPFEEVYLINLVEREDRYKMMKDQFSYLGWEVKDHRVVIHPSNQTIFDNCKSKFKYVSHPNAISCTYEHYTLIKSAYLRSVESILIIEDDTHFIKKEDIWNEYMNAIPEDFDILRLCCHRWTLSNSQELWIRTGRPMWGTGCYALSRNGMKYMIDSIDKVFQPIDGPLYDIAYESDIKHYICNTPLGIHLEDSFNNNIIKLGEFNPLFIGYTKQLNIEDYL